MPDMASMGSVASVLGLVVAVVVAIYQRGEAQKSERKANAEKERAATLEDHLSRQRWQQLRSLGEQIDTLEKDQRHTADATGAALHARLKEQYSAILGVIATSTPSFSAKLLRHWVYTGRLSRPWQVEEALSHVDPDSSNDDIEESEVWLRKLINDSKSSSGEALRSLCFPVELNEYAASYILVASSVKDQLLVFSKRGGQTAYSLAVLLDHLTQDALQVVSNKIGPVRHKTWGWDEKLSFSERFHHYLSIDFWVVHGAANHAQNKLLDYGEFFEKYNAVVKYVIPTDRATKLARKKYPEIADFVSKLWEDEENKCLGNPLD